MRKFELSQEQIDFLKKEYADNPLVQKVLTSENNRVFEVDIDTKIVLWITLKMSPYTGWERIMRLPQENAYARVYKR